MFKLTKYKIVREASKYRLTEDNFTVYKRTLWWWDYMSSWGTEEEARRHIMQLKQKKIVIYEE